MKNRYPFIFVHGMLGWGERELFYKPAPYWGMVCGNLMKQLRSAGYEAYAPKVGPMNSAWDRACELYALLTGTRVDYGKAHSEQKHHERFGRTYEQRCFPDGAVRKKSICSVTASAVPQSVSSPNSSRTVTRRSGTAPLPRNSRRCLPADTGTGSPR